MVATALMVLMEAQAQLDRQDQLGLQAVLDLPDPQPDSAHQQQVQDLLVLQQAVPTLLRYLLLVYLRVHQDLPVPQEVPDLLLVLEHHRFLVVH